MAQNAWFAQFLADVLETPVEVPASHETTALGAAALAGIGSGIMTGIDAFSRSWKHHKRYETQMNSVKRSDLLVGWKTIIARELR
jgi:glycerol kinase